MSSRLVLALCLLGACAAPADDPPAQGATVRTVGPYSPDSVGSDLSDLDCQVVLRDVTRLPNGTGGYEVNVVDGQRHFVWEGHLDLSAELVDAGASPAVLFEYVGDQWWEVDAWEVSGSPSGFQRYAFRLDEQTPTEGMSLTSLMNVEIQLIPMARTVAGDRLFDHNRNPGDFENYTLVADNSWSIEDDGASCVPTELRPSSTLEFRHDWSEVQHGAIVPGGLLRVEYDLYRLPDCFGDTYMGQATWNTNAHLRFLPGGELVEGGVVDCHDPACLEFDAAPLEVEVPAFATGVELWFSTAGRTCGSHWDSNFGANYLFATGSTPVDVGWAGDWGYSISRGMDQRSEEVPEPLVIDSWVISRADIRTVDAEVYVPGLTETSDRPELLLARAEVSRDGAEPVLHWLDHVGRDDNNYRFELDLFAEDMVYTPWDRFDYFLSFSTDGHTWYRIGLDEGPDAVEPRTIERADDWCPEAYWGDWCAE